MRLQRGRFVVKTEEEIEKAIQNNVDLNKVIRLSYMGKAEYEGNTLPISRMIMEYQKDEYQYCITNTLDANGKPMIIFMNTTNLVDNLEIILDKLSKIYIDENYSLWKYMKDPNEKYVYDFWWDIDRDSLIFFGQEKIPLIEYFLNSCYQRDGGKEEIEKILSKYIKLD